ncbi:hypothetical protein HMI56_002397 [Coelomomyces lativittatus]|nr:hypothetical protein HMI56_002397 [Coelomomyces lativittatus]
MSDKFPLKEPLMPTSIVQRTFSKSISSEDIEPSISWPHIQRPTHATFNGRASPAIATTTASVREVSIETPTATKRRPLPMTTQLQNSETNSPEFFKGLPSSRISVFNPLIADKNDMKPGETLSQIQSQTMSSFQPSNVSFNDFEANTSHLDLNKKISISSGEKFNSTATQPEGTQDPISNRLKIFLAAGGSALLLAFGTGSILYLSLKKKKSGIGFADSSVNGVKSHMEEEVYFVHIPYVPELEDELKLSVGDQVIIQERFQDKWVLGTNLTTGDSGCFPLLCLNADAASSIGSEYDISTIESSTYINCVYQEKQSRTSSLFKGRQ